MLRTISRLRTHLPPRSFLPPPPPPPPPPLFLLSSPFSTSSRRKKKSEVGEEGDDDGVGSLFVLQRDPTRPPNLFVVQPRLRPDALLESKLSEALNLANSLEEPRDGFYAEEFGSKKLPPHLIVQNPAARSAKAHADTYFGPGTVDNVKCHIKGLESELQSGIDAVFINANLSGIQQRNLEVAWAKPVLDRVGLIIEIFDAHAETKEAKLQSELAALMYKKTRLVRVRGSGGQLTFGPSGEAEVVSARGRGSGGRGFVGGAGETELQLQRRRIRERRNNLLAQIEEVRRTRALQRSSRRRHGYGQGLATVAVVGYTNAGKSTLVSALTETDLFSDDRLFATVDPRLRSVILPSGRKAILSDTVGFISDLPVQLVEAFHATLEEVVEADLLVHVLDSSAPNLEEHCSTVLQVLQQIGVSEDKIQNMIEVWNKSDLLEEKSQVNGPLDKDDFLAEGEEEEDGTFSEGEDDVASEISSCEPLDDYDMASVQLSDESIENSDEITSELSPCELVNDDSLVDELSMEERLDNFDDQQSASSKDWEMTKQTSPSCHVKTSAVMGIGLQELLILIDEKLNDQKSVVQRSYGPFDRKWRPSCTSDDEKAGE